MTTVIGFRVTAAEKALLDAASRVEARLGDRAILGTWMRRTLLREAQRAVTAASAALGSARAPSRRSRRGRRS